AARPESDGNADLWLGDRACDLLPFWSRHDGVCRPADANASPRVPDRADRSCQHLDVLGSMRRLSACLAVGVARGCATALVVRAPALRCRRVRLHLFDAAMAGC